MLPWADRGRISHMKDVIVYERAHCIGNNAITGPISAANDIACAGRGNSYTVLGELLWSKEGISECGNDEFSAGLAVAIRIVPTQGILFAVRPKPLFVLIAFIRGDDDDGSH
jgi:hypothetical protein